MNHLWSNHAMYRVMTRCNHNFTDLCDDLINASRFRSANAPPAKYVAIGKLGRYVMGDNMSVITYIK